MASDGEFPTEDDQKSRIAARRSRVAARKAALSTGTSHLHRRTTACHSVRAASTSGPLVVG